MWELTKSRFSDSEATVVVKITSFVLGVVRQLQALHGYFSPHSQVRAKRKVILVNIKTLHCVHQRFFFYCYRWAFLLRNILLSVTGGDLCLFCKQHCLWDLLRGRQLCFCFYLQGNFHTCSSFTPPPPLCCCWKTGKEGGRDLQGAYECEGEGPWCREHAIQVKVTIIIALLSEGYNNYCTIISYFVW